MNLSREELIKALVKGLKIDDNVFSYQAVAEEVEQIKDSLFMDFYKAVMNAETFGNGIKAVSIVANDFKNKKTDNVLAGTHEQAKAMYDKFYYECCSMLDYTQKDRNKTPNDREFFRNMPYGELKRTDGSPTYTKRELFVLNALGGGEWLIDIRLALSSKEIIDKIEKTIREAVLTKYNNQKQIEDKRVGQMVKRLRY